MGSGLEDNVLEPPTDTAISRITNTTLSSDQMIRYKSSSIFYFWRRLILSGNAGQLPIISHHALGQHLSTQSAILIVRSLFRMVTDAVLAWDEDRCCRAMPARVDTVVTCATGYVSVQQAVSCYCIRRLSDNINAVLVKLDSRQFLICVPYDGKRYQLFSGQSSLSCASTASTVASPDAVRSEASLGLRGSLLVAHQGSRVSSVWTAESHRYLQHPCIGAQSLVVSLMPMHQETA